MCGPLLCQTHPSRFPSWDCFVSFSTGQQPSQHSPTEPHAISCMCLSPSQALHYTHYTPVYCVYVSHTYVCGMCMCGNFIAAAKSDQTCPSRFPNMVMGVITRESVHEVRDRCYGIR